MPRWLSANKYRVSVMLLCLTIFLEMVFYLHLELEIRITQTPSFADPEFRIIDSTLLIQETIVSNVTHNITTILWKLYRRKYLADTCLLT